MACSMGATGESIYSLGDPKQLTLEEKVKKSSASATLVAIGSFAPSSKGGTPEAFSAEESFIWVQFTVDDLLVGDVTIKKGQKLKIKVPILQAGGAPSASERASSADRSEMAASLQELERNLERKKVTAPAYDEETKKLREALRRRDDYLAKFVLMPVKAGVGDFTYRSAVVPIVWGEKYVLFLLRSRTSVDDETPFFPWEIDVYPNSADVTRILRK